IYSTALPPMAAAAATCALELLDTDRTLVANLRTRIAELGAALAATGLAASPTATAIQPLIVGTAERAMNASLALSARGLLVPAIRPPTVPEGTSRLRISLSAEHSRQEVEALARALPGSLAP